MINLLSKSEYEATVAHSLWYDVKNTNMKGVKLTCNASCLLFLNTDQRLGVANNLVYNPFSAAFKIILHFTSTCVLLEYDCRAEDA